MSFLKTPYLAYNYNSLILPRLNYCISILAWEYDSKQIYKLEQRAIRIISKRKLYSHSDLIKKNLKWKIRRRDIMWMILSCSDNHWFCPKNHRLFSLQIAKSTHSGQIQVCPPQSDAYITPMLNTLNESQHINSNQDTLFQFLYTIWTKIYLRCYMKQN